MEVVCRGGGKGKAGPLAREPLRLKPPKPGGADTSYGARPPVFDMLGMIIPHKQSEKSRPQSVDSKANDKNACYVYEAVN